MRRAAFLALLILAARPAQAGCAAEPDPCKIEAGSYHIALPREADGAPVVMFLHGWGSHGGATIATERLVAPLLARGHAVIAPNGMPWEAGRPNGSWNFYPGRDPEGRDERAFLKGVARSAAARFGVDPERVVLGGFSAGGFMVSYLACDHPESFAAYAPVSGGFWRPHPDSCAGPVRLLHTHGWMDTVVPLEGRPLGGGRFQQGDIFAGLEIWRRTNGCDAMRPDGLDNDGAFWIRRWTDCADDGALAFALFSGGHTVPEGWADFMLDWLEGLDR